MPVYRYPRIRASEITPEEIWESRRTWMKAAGATFAAGTLAGFPQMSSAASLSKLDAKRSTQFVLMEPITPEKDATTYNNFF